MLRRSAPPLVSVLAATMFAFFAAVTAAPAQGLDPPPNPLCKPCEGAIGVYWEAWPALDARLGALDKQERELKELLDAAKESRRKHIMSGDGSRSDYAKILAGLDADIKRIEGKLAALYDGRAKAYQEAEGRQLAIAGCIKRKCYMGSEGPAPSTPAGDAEKCKQCAPLANRVALLDYRLGELNEIDKLLVKDEWHTESRKWFTKRQREAGGEMSVALDEARKDTQKELEACRARTKDKCDGLDQCVIGTWRSEPVTSVGRKSTGGDGIVLTIKEDGTAHVDYTKMKPMPGSSITSPASNLWQGTATGRIETSDGKVSVTSVEKSDLSAKITDPQGKVRTNRLSSGLGPVLPSGAKIEYSCEKDTLTTKVYGYEFTFKRVP